MPALPPLVSNNLPWVKPELWSHPLGNVARRFKAWAALRGSSQPVLARILPEGLRIRVYPSDAIGKPILYYGCYEYAPSQLVRAYLRPGDTVIDVGANIGYYTLLCASSVGASGKVIAFEPEHDLRRQLTENVTLNGFSHVEVRHEAVTERSGQVSWVHVDTENNRGLSHAGLEGAETVSALALDDLGVGDVTMIKMDIEGGEPAAFAGAVNLLSRADAPAVLFESFGISRECAFLEQYGYQVYQPVLVPRGLRLRRASLDGKGYRRWEAPNYWAVKSSRALAFAASMQV